MGEVTGRLLADCESVHGYVVRICFKNGPPGRVGAELEWLVAPRDQPRDHIQLRSVENVCSAAASLPGGSRMTLEPGGQVELSSQVAPDLNTCWHGLQRDIDTLDRLLSRQHLVRLSTAIDPWRQPVRHVSSPRYDAMQDYFDRDGAAGRVMMTSTAAVQVNLDAGLDPADVRRRWGLVHAIGPTLLAAFANSPVHAGRLTGWKSTRQRVWQALDPARVTAVTATASVTEDPAASWAEYALAAPVMMLRRPGRWLPAPGFTFREWVNGAAGLERPTEDDLAYHLTTLFPPVRPRAWLEVRYLDAQPPGLWPVPIAVVTALLEDATAGDRAAEATEPVCNRWREAARLGLDDPPLARAAARCFDAALDALPRLGAEPGLLSMVGRFVERCVLRQRCPADGQLDQRSMSDPRPRTERSCCDDG